MTIQQRGLSGGRLHRQDKVHRVKKWLFCLINLCWSRSWADSQSHPSGFGLEAGLHRAQLCHFEAIGSLLWVPASLCSHTALLLCFLSGQFLNCIKFITKPSLTGMGVEHPLGTAKRDFYILCKYFKAWASLISVLCDSCSSGVCPDSCATFQVIWCLKSYLFAEDFFFFFSFVQGN